jgi:hypothetical protein
MEKMILIYVAGTLNFGLWYTQSEDNHLSSYTDIDFVGNLDDRKAPQGTLFTLTRI